MSAKLPTIRHPIFSQSANKQPLSELDKILEILTEPERKIVTALARTEPDDVIANAMGMEIDEFKKLEIAIYDKIGVLNRQGLYVKIGMLLDVPRGRTEVVLSETEAATLSDKPSDIYKELPKSHKQIVDWIIEGYGQKSIIKALDQMYSKGAVARILQSIFSVFKTDSFIQIRAMFPERQQPDQSVEAIPPIPHR